MQDIIIAPDRSISYVIVGAGGFIGIGRHDVAIPVTQIQGQAGKLVIPGATVALIKAMPQFEYADDNDGVRRAEFVNAAEKDITRGRAKLAELERNAGEATADAKAKIDLHITTLRLDVESAQAQISKLNQASVNRWREFETNVSDATARVRDAIERARAE